MLLSTNPCLIFWPSAVTGLAHVQPDGRIEAIGAVPNGLLALLNQWRSPATVGEMEEALANEGLNATTQSLLARKILSIHDDNIPTLKDWEGFRLADAHATLSLPGCNELQVEERTEVDFPVSVIDSSVNAASMKTLARWFSSQSFSLIDVDSDNTSTNKHWVRPLDANVRRLLAVPVLGWLDAICRLCVPDLHLTLVEIKAYQTLYGDVPTYHNDSKVGPTITAVLYCHPEWDLDWSGELLIADRAGEPRIAIYPKPGRLVVFRGDLPHKAGAPSRITHSARQTLVFRYDVQE